jgi:tetratricopeptide (TPR) repeat protein
MTIIMKLKSLYEKKDFYQALELFTSEISRLQNLRYSEFKNELIKVENAEDFQVLIRLTDHFLMYHYSSFIARYAYRRFQNEITVTWYCEELLDNGKLLEADEIISHVIAENQGDIRDSETLERIYFCKIRCLLEMKRYKEAEKLVEKVKESPRPIADKLGYVYMQLGNREKAKGYLQEGMDNPERGQICCLLLADLMAANGQLEESLQIIEQGESQFPDTPSFLLEKVRRYRDLGKPTEMLAVIKELNDRIPNHSFKKYFYHLNSIAFYQLEDFDQLEANMNEKQIKQSLFKRKHEQGELIKLKIKPIMQKSNYCVPASLEMILNYYGMEINQDEIASHIFDFTGSKLSTTVEYLEKIGYECRYFIGNKELYEGLLKIDIPILLSVDFEHASHVQVLTGYDSRFDFYHIQDPNMLETLYVSSGELEKANAASSHMSIVFVPKDRARELAFLSNEEDTYFRTLHDLGEKMEVDETLHKGPFFQFLQINKHFSYTPIYVVKHFSFEEYQDFILQCAEIILERYPGNDFIHLHAAQAYIRLQQMEQAKELLKLIERKTFSPLYHFLNGRIALHFDRMNEAVDYFRTSLQLDPDQYYTWSYLALSYLYSNDIQKAEYFSTIGLELAPNDRFVRINYAAVLIEKEEFKEARSLYTQLLREDPQDAHVWYERARLDQKQGKLRKAIRGYLMSIKLENSAAYAHLAAADLYEYEFELPQRAEEILLSGLETAKSSQLYVRLGDFYYEQDDRNKAASFYQKSIDLFPNDPFAYIEMADIIACTENKDSALHFINEHLERFEDDSEFLINIGRMMAEWAKEEEDIPLLEKSLLQIENGISKIHANLNEALELYVRTVEETPFTDRGITFLDIKSRENPSLIEYKCYQGTLYEEKSQYTSALECYNKALQIKEDSFPYYRLGEVYFKLGKYEQAIDALEKCLRYNSQIEPAYLRLAEIASINENVEQEAEYLFSLLDIEPSSVNAEYLSSILDEDKLHQFLVKLQALENKVSEAWRLDAVSYVCGALGKTEEENRCLTAALELEPDLPELLHHQAKLYIKTRKFTKVSSILEELLNKCPEDEDLYLTLIEFIASANKWSRLPNFLFQLKGTKEEKSSKFLLAAEAGQQFFTEVIWNDEEEGNMFGRMVRKLKNRTKQISLFGSIIELYETAIKLDKENPYPVSLFAKFHENFDLIDDSIKILQKALRNKWDAHLAYQLGMNYMEVKDYQAALFLFEKCLSGDSQNISIKMQLSITYSFLDENEKALTLVNDVLHIEEENILAHYHKACFLALLKRPNEAQLEIDYVFEHDLDGYYRDMAQNDKNLMTLMAVQS